MSVTNTVGMFVYEKVIFGQICLVNIQNTDSCNMIKYHLLLIIMIMNVPVKSGMFTFSLSYCPEHTVDMQLYGDYSGLDAMKQYNSIEKNIKLLWWCLIKKNLNWFYHISPLFALKSSLVEFLEK